MIYKLLGDIKPGYTTVEQVMTNRGVDYGKIDKYLNLNETDLADPSAFGEDRMKAGARMVTKAIKENNKTLIVVDSDDDGFTSAAIMLNYFNDIFPNWVENQIDWVFHEGKQHGLGDHMDTIRNKGYKLVICPDSSSNDYEEHKLLKDSGVDVLVLDHHEADRISEDAVVINNQLSDYPNKSLSGAGVAWQFCRYLDRLLGQNHANKYRDLVALGLTGDMMSQLSFETKYLIENGFRVDNIMNPFIYGMWEKNKFKLGEQITPIGAAFYIVPFVNAICRSGSMEEKALVFDSMLTFRAFIMVPSTKRGHKQGEMERVLDQALRTCTNVKVRQTKAQDEGMEHLEHLIEENDMLKHKVLLFILSPGEVKSEIRGLIANKLMAKYQRPCCILTAVTDNYGNVVSYQGSARGYDKSGVTNFKDICSEIPGVSFAVGHQSAFGLGIAAESPDEEKVAGDSLYQFWEATDEVLKDMSSEPIYYVDYIFYPNQDFGQTVLDIADMDRHWGKDFDEPLIVIEQVTIPAGAPNFHVMKSNTLKITLPNGIDIIKFNGTEDEIQLFTPQNKEVTLDLVCKCRKNEWHFEVRPQLELIDYRIHEGWVF